MQVRRIHYLAMGLLSCLLMLANGKQAWAQRTYSSQAYRVYINNPGRMHQRVRIRAEYLLTDEHAIALTASYFYPKRDNFDGPQFLAEHRFYYHKRQKGFTYVKAGGGMAYGMQIRYRSGGYTNHAGIEVPVKIQRGDLPHYFVGGFGLGQHFFLGKEKRMILEFTEGFQFARSAWEELQFWGNPSFSVWGPTALLNVQINLGYRL